MAWVTWAMQTSVSLECKETGRKSWNTPQRLACVLPVMSSSKVIIDELIVNARVHIYVRIHTYTTQSTHELCLFKSSLPIKSPCPTYMRARNLWPKIGYFDLERCLTTQRHNPCHFCHLIPFPDFWYQTPHTKLFLIWNSKKFALELV